MFSTAQLKAIVAGGLDAGFCYTFEALPEGCQALLLRMDTVVLAVPRRYGWKKRGDVRLEDLKTEAFVGLSRSIAPAYVDRIVSTTYASGLSPNIVQEAIDERTLLSLVSAGIGVGFCNSANEGRKPKLVDLVPVIDLDLKLPLCFIWKQSNSSAALSAFRSIVSRHQDMDRQT